MKALPLTHPSVLALIFAALASACGPEVREGDPSGTGGSGDTGGSGSGGGGQTGSDEGGDSDTSPPYEETICDPLASLDGLKAGYTAAELRNAAEGVAVARYPEGLAVLVAQTDGELSRWFRDPNSWNGLLAGFSVAVHEGTHLWDIRKATGNSWTYRVRDDVIITTKRLQNFPRSEIVKLHADAASDIYLGVYLTGQSGQQGFNLLLEEYNAYVHSLAADYCLRDRLGGQSVSAKDGILTFMYYVEIYLKLARTEHPDDYEEILGDPEHIRAILTIWDRAEFWLVLAEPHRSLGIKDAKIRGWVYTPLNFAEIEALRLPEP